MRTVRKRLSRVTTTAISIVLALGTIAAGNPAQARVDSGDPHSADVAFTVVNAPNPISFRAHPNWSYPHNLDYFHNGDQLWLSCYFLGGPAGQYNNPLWYVAYHWGGGNGGLVNDTYLNTPGTAANPQPQTPPCDPAGYGNPLATFGDFTAVNAPGTVNWGNSPSTMWPAGFGFTNGDRIGLNCYFFGAPAGPHGNRLWYLAYDWNRNTYGWINDHHLNTPGTAANPQPQTGRCWSWAF